MATVPTVHVSTAGSAARSGDVVVTPRGWKGTWEVHETCRKVYNLIR